ncbi:1,3-propanediol dehydrogenase [Pelotomaculum sp. FP]|uniref:iron-containing alcohol dehydrogenase n=1 Tax=Pelotomaculum sp. FP TaxID=261474 RepID=UPI0010657E69|nr:iron-containing alcohol dehydrogenase [Pelotomaculum sp. FP]TEB16398.1 1,3-propanediol dehydrogenase [Pelotomaculum sp. FP]
MLEQFSFLSAQEIQFGLGVVKSVGNVCKKLKLNSVLVVSDPFMVESGSVKKVTAVLEDSGIVYSVYSDFGASPAISKVEKAYEFMLEKGYNGVIGFGGGSSLDTAKAIAILLNNPLPISQYFGVDQVPNPACPMIMIPTTAGTGSEVSDACILKDDKTHVKSGIRSKYLMANVSLVDPELTISMPPSLTAATGMDALTHCIEGYVSNASSVMTRMFHREAINLIFKNLRTAVGNGSDIDARYNVMLGAMYAGWAMAVASLGACHAMAYPIEGKYGASHGVANAALLPAVMRYNALGDMEKFRDMAIFMGENVEGLSVREAAYKAVEAVETLAKDIDIPTLSAIGVVESDLEPFAEISYNNTRLMGLNPRKMTIEAIQKVYKDAF